MTFDVTCVVRRPYPIKPSIAAVLSSSVEGNPSGFSQLEPSNTESPGESGDFDVPRVFRSLFVSLQALMHPRVVHDAPTLSARVSPKNP